MNWRRLVWLVQWLLFSLSVLFVLTASILASLREAAEGGFTFGVGIGGMFAGIFVIPLVFLVSCVHFAITKRRSDVFLMIVSIAWAGWAIMTYVNFPY